MGFADVLTSIFSSVVGAVCNFLCAPLYDKIKPSWDVLNKPELLSEDVRTLRELMNVIETMSRPDFMDEWLSEAEKVMQKVPQVLLERERSSGPNRRLQPSCCIFSHGVSRYKLHKKVRKLKIKGQGFITCANRNDEPVENIRGVPLIEDGSTADRNLKQVMDLLEDDEVWSIGVWGPGGVGKTTLVNVLNNKLKSTSSFNLVRLISLTRDDNECQLQQAIVESLNVKVEDGSNTRRIADGIYNKLQRKKFLLILDNVWKSFNLASIGVPENLNGSKVIMTTRLEKVCEVMKAKKIKIGCLTPTEAWKLFTEKAGDDVDSVEIQPLAKKVCEECGGLPLAIIAVGSAMRGKTDIRLWQSALNDLRSSVFPDGIESQVYKALKWSFDSLPGDPLKLCFLYCSLYPQSYEIYISELVHCWIAENIISEQLTYQSAYCKGLELIETLKSSCLLEDGAWKGTAKMHDVVRDVAIQIGKSNGTLIVFSGCGNSNRPTIELSEEVERVKWISFVDNERIELPGYKKDFPNVTTILVCKTKAHVHVSEEFLQGFPAVKES